MIPILTNAKYKDARRYGGYNIQRYKARQGLHILRPRLFQITALKNSAPSAVSEWTPWSKGWKPTRAMIGKSVTLLLIAPTQSSIEEWTEGPRILRTIRDSTVPLGTRIAFSWKTSGVPRVSMTEGNARQMYS